MDPIERRANRAEEELEHEKRLLAVNAWHLARYVIEQEIEVKNFDAGMFLTWCEKYPELDESHKVTFFNEYRKLERAVHGVTARSLYATRIHGNGFLFAIMHTSVGQYLFMLGLITLGFVVLIIQGMTTKNGVTLNPFFAAGLGTCVFLLRATQERLVTREFDPAFIPSHLIRLSLGVLAGGTLVLFPEIIDTGKSSGKAAANANANEITLHVDAARGALAFVLGYAVDLYYAILDRLGGRVRRRRRQVAA